MDCIIVIAGCEGVLTTSHAASSYGLPVLVVAGQAYGPGDTLSDGRLCGQAVIAWARRKGRSNTEIKAAIAYIRQDGTLAGSVLGLEITRRRRRAKLTQIQAADKAGIGQGHWSDVEAGTQAPTLATLNKVASSLGCNAKDLL